MLSIPWQLVTALSPTPCALTLNRNSELMQNTFQEHKLGPLGRLTSTSWQENYSNMGSSSCALVPPGVPTSVCPRVASYLNYHLDAWIHKRQFLRITPTGQQRTSWIHNGSTYHKGVHRAAPHRHQPPPSVPRYKLTDL